MSDHKRGEALSPKPHHVGREMVNYVAPSPIRILLEPPVADQDDFELKGTKGKSSANHRPPVKVGREGHLTIEFENVHDARDAFYEFLHMRGTSKGGGPEREVIEGNLPGHNLTRPDWNRPGEPATIPLELDRSKINEPRRTPLAPRDELLSEDVNLQKVRVQEPKMESHK